MRAGEGEGGGRERGGKGSKKKKKKVISLYVIHLPAPTCIHSVTKDYVH